MILTITVVWNCQNDLIFVHYVTTMGARYHEFAQLDVHNLLKIGRRVPDFQADPVREGCPPLHARPSNPRPQGCD